MKDKYHNMDDDDPKRTHQYLMDKAKNKFKIMNKEGAWDSRLKEKDREVKRQPRKELISPGIQKISTSLSSLMVRSGTGVQKKLVENAQGCCTGTSQANAKALQRVLMMMLPKHQRKEPKAKIKQRRGSN